MQVPGSKRDQPSLLERSTVAQRDDDLRAASSVHAGKDPDQRPRLPDRLARLVRVDGPEREGRRPPASTEERHAEAAAQRRAAVLDDRDAIETAVSRDVAA